MQGTTNSLILSAPLSPSPVPALSLSKKTNARKTFPKFEDVAYGYTQVDRKKPPPPGGFPIYYVPSSRTASKRTPLEAPGTNSSRGVLLHTVLDEGT